MKTCSKCKIEKPLDQFHKAKHGAQGRIAACIQCRSSLRSKKLQELGGVRRNRNLPITPEEDAIIRGMLLKGKPIKAVSDATQLGRDRLQKYISKHKIERGPLQGVKVEMPADFAQNADMPVAWLVEHYNRGKQLIRKWREAVGAKIIRRPRRAPEERKVARPAAISPRLQPVSLVSKYVYNHERPDGLAGLAQRHLQGLLAPVCRIGSGNMRFSNIRNPDGTLADTEDWHVGKRIMTTAEMIAYAEQMGFQNPYSIAA